MILIYYSRNLESKNSFNIDELNEYLSQIIKAPLGKKMTRNGVDL